MLSHTTLRIPRPLLIIMIIISFILYSGSGALPVGKVSRHGVRPPTESNTTALESGTAREWPQWVTREGELTGHGYAATVLKRHYEGEYYRQQHLFADTVERSKAVIERGIELSELPAYGKRRAVPFRYHNETHAKKYR